MRISITGGKILRGTINISGMKNAALPIIFACILANDVCVVGNIPNITDVKCSFDILRNMGVKITKISPNMYEIDTREFNIDGDPGEGFVGSLRASYYILGAELGRFNRAFNYLSGGCDLGRRPIDMHLSCFEKLGATWSCPQGKVIVKCDGELKGANISFDSISVGATINAILASVKAEGTTTIENAAREPHIVDVANFLNACGANISGAGSSEIRIVGTKSLHAPTNPYIVIPDMIEAGTYLMAAGAVADSEIRVENVIPKHLESTVSVMKEMGFEISEDGDSITAKRKETLSPVSVKTRPYPGFPTDMHPQLMALLATVGGSINETVWDGRFNYSKALSDMGGAFVKSGSVISVVKPSSLKGASINATDLRGGAAMVIAALAAEGETVIDSIAFIERGYENIVEKLKSVGADIKYAD